MNHEDAVNWIIHVIKNKEASSYSAYGYGVYLPGVISTYVSEIEKLTYPESERRVIELSPVFYSAAWELCLKGVLRPGILKKGAQGTDNGRDGEGYCLTPFGRQWISEFENENYVPTDPSRFGEMLKPYAERLGPGFFQRSQEAVRCYRSGAYLGCCAMCGASAESIILAVACHIESEEEVLKKYATAQGRKRVEDIILGKQNDWIQRTFRGFTNLLNYWRNEAAHGAETKISEYEAYNSLGSLLRFARFTVEKWDELTNT